MKKKLGKGILAILTVLGIATVVSASEKTMELQGEIGGVHAEHSIRSVQPEIKDKVLGYGPAVTLRYSSADYDGGFCLHGRLFSRYDGVVIDRNENELNEQADGFSIGGEVLFKRTTLNLFGYPTRGFLNVGLAFDNTRMKLDDPAGERSEERNIKDLTGSIAFYCIPDIFHDNPFFHRSGVIKLFYENRVSELDKDMWGGELQFNRIPWGDNARNTLVLGAKHGLLEIAEDIIYEGNEMYASLHTELELAPGAYIGVLLKGNTQEFNLDTIRGYSGPISSQRNHVYIPLESSDLSGTLTLHLVF